MAEHEYYEVNGRQIRVRPTESGQEIDEYGNFHRQPNHFTKGFGEGENPVEADRYILFWGKGCNWSNRASIARELLGLARNQEAYEEAYHMVFNRLDWLEERLADRRYLFGDKITESDVRLYVTLARFDVAYHNIFRVNKKRLRDYDNLWAYARDLYQTPGFWDTTDFAAIKKHYHIDCNPGNIHQIIAKGPDEEAWLLPHGREKLSEK